MDLNELPYWVQTGIRGVRVITVKHVKAVTNSEGLPCCRWCRTVVTGRKKYWCSLECYKKFEKLQAVPSTIAHRDGYHCRICRVDVDKVNMKLKQIWATYERAEHLRRKIEEGEEIEKSYGTKAMGYWIAKSEDVNEFQGLLTELEHFSQIHPRLMKKLKNGLYRPKRTKAYEIDHVKPISEGGTTTSDNLRLVCTICHEEVTVTGLKKRKRKL